MTNLDKAKANPQKILTAYLNEIHEIYAAGNFREESFYSFLKDLFEGCSSAFSAGEGAGVLVLPKKTEVGIPDFLVRRGSGGGGGEIVGHVEAKTPGTSLQAAENSEQIQRYRAALPNLILTNFLEFWLYRNGKFVASVEVCKFSDLELASLREAVPAEESAGLFVEFMSRFYGFSTPAVKTASELAALLAEKTRLSRAVLEEVLEKEAEPDFIPVASFYEAFRNSLIAGLTKAEFVDLYAQTITYGLFAAKMIAGAEEEVKEINRDNAWEFIPGSVALLRKMFYIFSGPNTPEALRWIVEDTINVLNKADVRAISEAEDTAGVADRDPIIHFYDTFLGEYNPAEKKRLGVFYTPPEVVAYIVGSVHGLLKSEFGKDQGLAEYGVKLLDPAAGTLTFLIRAIGRAFAELTENRLDGLVRANLKGHILTDFFAFELLIVPYVVGHLRAAMYLKDKWGLELEAGERVRFYLTNALEMQEPAQVPLLPELTAEGQAAKRVKEKEQILVVLGNPPYSGVSENKGDWITELIEDYKYVDGRHFGEKKHWLQDDYVKFIRFGQWKIDRAGEGILAFLTNHSYLDNPTFRGMRQSLMRSFDRIYVLNLHGNSLKKEQCPDGSKDENVFEIRQGVAISLFVKNRSLKKKKEQVARVFYADLWGRREEKYRWLWENELETTEWEELKPSSPFYFFVPRQEAGREEYERFWKVTDIFPVNCTGVVTARDRFVIDFERAALKRRIERFRDLSVSDESVRREFELKENYMWRVKKARSELSKVQNWEDYFTKILYRPFDIREIYFHDSVVWRTRRKVMRHMRQENLGLVTVRQVAEGIFNHAFVTNGIIESRITLSNKGIGYLFPLYLYSFKPKRAKLSDEEASEPERVPNLSKEFLQAVKEALGTEPTAEEIFYYIYAVLYSPSYRRRYEEFLKVDFPRVPLPSASEEGKGKFKRLSELGKELVELHLLRHPSLSGAGAGGVGFPVSGSNKVERVRYDEKTERVYFNKQQYFDGVSKPVWEYQIGGYQVLAKYLKDRKGRELSWQEVEHFRRVVKAVERTRVVQGEVEEER
ncbi:MAG: N-6 DNA methylase [Methanophagales archaeon]|nr:N-6 DNA methylase [Methanophagales archaeon]